jgi:hypothetical protein
MGPIPLGSDDADIVRAAQLRHTVEDINRHVEDRQSDPAAALPETDRPYPDSSASAPQCRWRHQRSDFSLIHRQPCQRFFLGRQMQGQQCLQGE